MLVRSQSNIFPQPQIRPHVDALAVPRAARDIRALLPSALSRSFHAARGDVNGGGWSVGQRFHALNVAPDHVSSAHAVCFGLKTAYHVCRNPPTQTTNNIHI